MAQKKKNQGRFRPADVDANRLDDWNPEEWGNLGIGDVTSDQLLTKDFRKSHAKTAEQREIHKEITRASWQKPEIKQKRLKNQKRAFADGRCHQKLSELLSGRMKTHTHNQKVSEWRLQQAELHSTHTREKISQTLSGTTHQRRRKVWIDGREFDSLKAAAEWAGMSPDGVKVRCGSPNFPGYSMGASQLHKRYSVETPDGVFETFDQAAKHYGITTKAIQHRCKKWPGWRQFYQE